MATNSGSRTVFFVWAFLGLFAGGYALNLGMVRSKMEKIEAPKGSTIIDSPIIETPFTIYDPNDPNHEGSGSNINLENPPNTNTQWAYDPITGNYYQTGGAAGNSNVTSPPFMTPEEYQNYSYEQAMRENWNNIVQQNEAENTSDGGVIPTIKAEKMNDAFGPGGIDIRPSGIAELSFGINTSKTENPQIPVRQRKISVFDFNQKIQLNVVGNIGDKLKLTTSYNTEATFDFENQMKLEYTGYDDEIIQKIEAGNVSLPLNGSLITGSQSLFGLKTALKFGKLNVTSVFSQQKGKRTEIQVAGGAQQSTYEITADNYEANKHFFLNHYHRDKFDVAMASLPIVNSGVSITRIEVWVTNNNNTVDNTRNIIAFSDLGESTTEGLEGTPNNISTNPLPRNNSNGIYNFLTSNTAFRNFGNATGALQAVVVQPGPFEQSVHYEKLQNARRLSDQEYSVNTVLGFISLNQPLNNDEVLAVAYEYTFQGQTYQVGEFSTDGIAGQEAIFLKLLKGTVTNPRFKRWDLIMKNIYSLGAYQVNKQNFTLQVWYNNPATSVDINYIPKPGLDDKPLIQILNLDRYDQNNQAYADGLFDFIPLTFAGNKSQGGGTINPQNGRVVFTTVEPFGTHLKNKLVAAGLDQTTINNIVYQPLYDSTKTAAQQIPKLNRFKIKGSYQSASSSEISLNALNIPQGAVKVTAGGVQLVENTDYTVDYNLGRVRILNQGLLESQTPINVSVESNTLFSIQTKTLLGTRFDYRVSKDIAVGGTILNMTERPLTQKINIGDEPISNTMIGLDGTFRREAPFLTRLVDKLPLISTKAKSTVNASFEYARLIPGTARAISGLSYVDDFEGSQSAIDLRSFNTWSLASVPKGQPDLFPEGSLINNLAYGMNRAKLAWYVIDPLFFNDNNLTPQHIRDNPAVISKAYSRQWFEQDVFPFRQLPAGQPTNIAVFDLAYFPEERGPYNYDTDGTSGFSAGTNTTNGKLFNPETRWAGIMRTLQTTDFEAANIEFIQIWMLDPFSADAVNDLGTTGGDFYINLGNVSEDILSDSRKSFENGLPVNSSFDPTTLENTVWGRVSTTQPVVNAFDNDPNSRLLQDVGYDGYDSNDEVDYFNNYVNWVSNNIPAADAAPLLADPSSDNFHYYRGDDYDQSSVDLLNRYKKFNGPEGNSPSNEFSAALNGDGYPTSATTIPNVEDINQDNNLSEAESYFQYKLSLRPNDMVIGRNFITNIYLTEAKELPDGSVKQEKWYQFKIPVREFQKRINGIADFRSIRFIRMFMKDWDKPTVLRFARLELIRGEWRIYRESLLADGEYIQGDPGGTLFSLSAVNIEENGRRDPVNYILPPGIQRQVDVATANLRNLNEQSLSMEVCGLKDGDARACYRNVDFDIRSYKRLKMFVHAESTAENGPEECRDNDATLFMRLGTDFTENYYEYELPLKMSNWYDNSEGNIWPDANNIDILFDSLIAVKQRRNNRVAAGIAFTNEIYTEEDRTLGGRLIKVIGNPNLQGLKIVMIGIRNPGKDGDNPWKPDDGKDKCLEVWINELRLTDFDQQGGWAALARMNANLADFGNVAFSGNYSTPYWGSIEKRVSERQRETIFGWDGSSSFELGKFFPEKWGIKLPLFLGYSESFINPQYDPLNPDILFQMSAADMTPEQKVAYKQKSQNYTRRRSMNFTNVRKEKSKTESKPMPWDISNWSATYSFNEIYHRDINVEYNTNKTYRGGLTYAYNSNPKPIEPFKDNKFLGKSKWFALIKDFNFTPLPKQIGFRNEINRTYTENLIRNNFDAISLPNYTKNFTWVRAYDLKYDLTKSLKVDFTANNNALITEPNGRVDKLYQEEYAAFKDSVNRSLRQFGTNMQYTHTSNVNLTLPLNKLPITDWITLTTRYSAGYEWKRAPLGQDSLGNVIQNNRNVSWSGQFNFTNLYNKVPYLKKLNQKLTSGSSGGKGKLGDNAKDKMKDKTKKITDAKDSTATAVKEKEKDEKEPIFTVKENVFRVLMSLKTVSMTFSTTDGILMPGYSQSTQMMGMNQNWSAPGTGFIFGKQNRDLLGRPADWGNGESEYAFHAAEKEWLIRNSSLNLPYVTNHSKNFSSRATIEPITGLRIEINADKNISENQSSFFRWHDSTSMYQMQNPMLNGMMSMSVITWKSAFSKDDTLGVSKVFENFRNNRVIASELLAGENPNSNGFSSTESGYRDGFGGTQQDVMISSFIAAYTGKNMDRKHTNPFALMPMPNWRITFDPMAKTKIKWIKEKFKSFTIGHGYRSSLTIANYTTNLNGTRDASGFIDNRDISDNFINSRQMNTVTISEQFSPLLNVDITWKVKNKGVENGLITKLEIKKDRSMSLSLTNNQLTEIKGKELVIGSGYRFSKVKLPFKIGNKPLESDLNCRADISIRNNSTITRKVVENQNQVTSGQNMISIKTSADYQINQKLTIRFYYDKVITKPKISTSFPTANTNSGIAIRFTL